MDEKRKWSLAWLVGVILVVLIAVLLARALSVPKAQDRLEIATGGGCSAALAKVHTTARESERKLRALDSRSTQAEQDDAWAAKRTNDAATEECLSTCHEAWPGRHRTVTLPDGHKIAEECSAAWQKGAGPECEVPIQADEQASLSDPPPCVVAGRVGGFN
jgi:hypothetical protein